eukprot:UN29110
MTLSRNDMTDEHNLPFDGSTHSQSIIEHTDVSPASQEASEEKRDSMDYSKGDFPSPVIAKVNVESRSEALEYVSPASEQYQVVNNPSINNNNPHFSNVAYGDGQSHVEDVQLLNPEDVFYCSIKSYVILLLLFVMYVVLFCIDWYVGLCSTIIYSLFIPFGLWWYKNRFHAPINQPISSFGFGCMTCVIALAFQGTGVCLVTFFLIITIVNLWTVLFSLFFIVLICVLFEEVLKLYVFQQQKIENPRLNETKQHLINATFISFGYIFMQTLTFITILYYCSRSITKPFTIIFVFTP